MEEVLYFLCSFFVAILAVCSAVVAYRALKTGLTYSSMAATLWVMVILAIGRVWHSTYEFFGLAHNLGDAAELIEYSIYIVAYLSFIWLATKTRKVEGSASRTAGTDPNF